MGPNVYQPWAGLRTAYLPTGLSQALTHECTSPDPSTRGSTSRATYNCITLTHRPTESLVCAQPCPMPTSIAPLLHTNSFHNPHCADTPLKGPARGLFQWIDWWRCWSLMTSVQSLSKEENWLPPPTSLSSPPTSHIPWHIHVLAHIQPH